VQYGEEILIESPDGFRALLLPADLVYEMADVLVAGVKDVDATLDRIEEEIELSKETRGKK
jgi:hypothetical protein